MYHLSWMNCRPPGLIPRSETFVDLIFYRRSKNQNQRDDVDFFFNENNNRSGTAKAGIMGLVRQDSKDSIDNYFKVSNGNIWAQ